MKLIYYPMVLLLAFQLNAQDSDKEKEDPSSKKFQLSGSVDAYFRQNISGPNGADAISPNTSFANLNGFALGMVNAIASYESEKVGFVGDLVFGPRGEDATFLSEILRPNGNSSIINQLFVYWNVSNAITLTFGNFNTFLGYEVISPVANFNYSTSYMFSYGPFSHTGLKADIAIDDNWSAMFGVFNNTDSTEFNLNNNYTLGAQLGFKDTFLNFLYGRQGNGSLESTFQVDLTTGHDITESFFLGLNATYNETDGSAFYGVALYPQFQLSEAFSIGARGEYFAETEGGSGAIGVYDDEGDASVIDLTLTGSYSVGDLTIKPEVRLDSTSEESFLDTDMVPTKSLTSFVLTAIYNFN